MLNSPPRKRFQMHLSTAVAMMFVAGGLIWANLRAEAPLFRPEGGWNSNFDIYGWPLLALDRERVPHVDRGPFYISFPKVTVVILGNEFNPLGVLGDLLIASFVLSATWFFCEWLIRRGAAQKEL